jgi:hypothetical protein
MPATSAKNMLRELCAIDFHIDSFDFDEKLDLVGTINFNKPVHVSEKGIIAEFGISACSLQVRMSSGQMPLRFQLAQKQLSIEPVGDVLKDVSHTVDREISGRGAIEGVIPKPSASLSASQKDARTVTGKAYQPEYLIHINLCGDDQFPAWQFRSVARDDPIEGTLRDTIFGTIVNFAPGLDVVVELKAAIHHDRGD